MEEKIIFEDYGIEFTEEDFKGVDKETLLKCKKILQKAIKNVERKGEEE